MGDMRDTRIFIRHVGNPVVIGLLVKMLQESGVPVDRPDPAFLNDLAGEERRDLHSVAQAAQDIEVILKLPLEAAAYVVAVRQAVRKFREHFPRNEVTIEERDTGAAG